MQNFDFYFPTLLFLILFYSGVHQYSEPASFFGIKSTNFFPLFFNFCPTSSSQTQSLLNSFLAPLLWRAPLATPQKQSRLRSNSDCFLVALQDIFPVLWFVLYSYVHLLGVDARVVTKTCRWIEIHMDFSFASEMGCRYAIFFFSFILCYSPS